MISRQMLVNQLRELEGDEILERFAYEESPPRVEYKITEYGHSLLAVLYVMQDWGINDLKNTKE